MERDPDKEIATLKPLVVFAILMENNEGIRFKSPDYILEKWESCQLFLNCQLLLDHVNKAKYDQWIERWIYGRPSHD